jgi:hypothetical protein
MKQPATLAPVIAAIVLVAAGGFLAGKPLTERDQYASVFSFVLAVMSLAFAYRSAHSTRNATPVPGHAAAGTEFEARHISYLVEGDDAEVDITRAVTPPGSSDQPATSDARFRAYDIGAAVVGHRGRVRISDSTDRPTGILSRLRAGRSRRAGE